MSACPKLSTGEAFLSTLLRNLDCQAQTIGATGYQALADPSSPATAVVTALLTIFVALVGYRMVLGETPTLRDGVVAVAKIGIVLAIAASWPAYRTVVYDLVVEGPGQIATAISRPSNLPGVDGDLIVRLQSVDAGVIRLTNLGVGRDDAGSTRPQRPTSPEDPAERIVVPDNPAFGAARVVYLTGVVATFAAVRLTAGILLAMAPLFAGLLLFDMARGLFVGWVRALVFTLLGSAAVTLLYGIELALLEPWLAQVLALRQARVVTSAAPVELLVMCLGFTLALVGSLGILLRLAFTIHIPSAPRLTAVFEAAPAPGPTVFSPSAFDRAAADRPSSRALAVAGAVRASQRREFAATLRPVTVAAGSGPQTVASPGNEFTIPSPVGHALRRAKPRKSPGASLRDRRS